MLKQFQKKINTTNQRKGGAFLVFLFVLLMSGVFSISLWTQVTEEGESSIEVLKNRVATVGKLAFKEDIPVQYVNKAQLVHYVNTFFSATYPEELAKKEAEYLRLMGFVQKAVDVYQIRKRILLDHVRGVYNEKTKELMVLNEYRQINYINSMYLIHELRHALQDAHFSLAQMLTIHSAFDDRQLAILAALEGDATFLMIQCNDLDAGTLTTSNDAGALLSFTPSPNPSLLYREPEIFRHQALMPYIEGLRFTNTIYAKKKWKGVNRILERPPDSTEQILHPEKYLDHEEPIPVEILFQPTNYKLYHTGVIGEYYLNVLLKTKDQDVLPTFAQGWGGDSFSIYKDPTTADYFLMWESEWDKEEFCTTFYEHFCRVIGKRFDVDFKKGTVNNQDFVAGHSGNDYYFITRTKKKIFYVRTNNKKQMNTFIYGGNYD